MWHHVLENTLPALIGAGVGGLIFGTTKQRSGARTAIMVLMLVLTAAATQVVWELFPQLRHGWKYFGVIFGIAALICIPFSFLMQRFGKKDDQDSSHTSLNK